MTDGRRREAASHYGEAVPHYTKYSVRDHETAPSPVTAGPARPARKRSVVAGRVVAAGIGIAAMVGLVANMEIAGQKADAAKAAAKTAPPSRRTATSTQTGAAPVRYAAVKAKKRPIVLTPHTVVHTVSAPAPVSGGGGYVASAPAAAPVASSGGS
jgi:hypothetical protein